MQNNDGKLNIENNLEHYKKISQEKDGEINEYKKIQKKRIKKSKKWNVI